MFKNLNRATTTTILAVLVVILCFGFFYLSGLGLSQATESTQTQINQGLFGIISLVTGYFFGASKNQDTTKDKQ